MGFLLDMLTAPVLGPIRGVHWLAQKIAGEADRQFLDEDKARAALLELQTRYDLGEVSDEEYDEQEAALLTWLNAVREAKTQRGQQ